jgi:hypothetical protein
MVLVMGCFASDSLQFSKHHFLYKRAISHLNMSSLALGILHCPASGTLRWLATPLLEQTQYSQCSHGSDLSYGFCYGLAPGTSAETLSGQLSECWVRSIVTRICTWWCIFCLDTWAAATLGHPGLGYWDLGTVLTSSTSALASMVRT